MKVLVVEDDAIVAKAIVALLTSHHYAVDVATDGLEGLEMAEAYSYDLMLLDIGLPGLNGVSLCQQLRTQGLQTPILLLTGQDVEAHAKATALNAGADDYVTKPFDAEELLARIQTLLRRGNLKALPVLQWGALALDPSRLQVSYGKTLLSLTPKEYTLLEVLLRHAPNILSAFAILEQGWNALENPSDEAIRTHIKEVRKKLKAAGAPDDFIKTVHRQGYRLNPLYGEAAFTTQNGAADSLQLAELKAVNEELRRTLEQLQRTQAELQQRNRDLQAARDSLEAQVAERTAVLSQWGADLAEDVEALELLRALSTRFVPNGDLQALYEEILSATIQLMKADGGTLQILDQASQELVLLASVGFDRTMTEHFARVNAQSNTPCGQVLATGQRTFVEFDAPASADPYGLLCLHHEAGYLSAQFTPLISRLGHAMGIFSTHWRSRHQPTNRELWFLDVLARQAADLIEQRQIHLALHQSEEKFRLFVAASSHSVYRMSPDWQEMRRLEGKNFLLTTEAPTRAWLDTYIPPAEQPRVWAAIQQAIRTRRFFELEHQVICQDGSIGWVFSRALPLLNEQGDIVEWLGAASNITDRKQAEIALHERDTLHRTLFEAIDEGICLFERLPLRPDGLRDYRYIAMNATMQAMFGIADLSGQSIRDNFPDEVEDWYDDYDRVLETGVPLRFERESVPQGMVLEMFVTRVEGDSGQRLLAVMKDVTARKQAEAQLRQSAQLNAYRVQLSDALRSLADPVQIQAEGCRVLGEQLGVDRAYYVDVNEAEGYAQVHQNYLRGDSPSLVGRFPLAEYGWVVPYLRAGEIIAVSDVATADIVPEADRELMMAIAIRSHISLPLIKTGQLVGALCVTDCVPRQWSATDLDLVRETAERVWADIQRARAEAALYQSEERYRQLVELTPQLVWHADAQGHTYISPQLSEYTGLSPDQLVDFGWPMVIHPDDVDRIGRRWRESMQTGDPYEVEYRLRRADGEYRWHLARAIPTDSDQGRQWFGVSTDIHDRKQLEEALRASEAQLSRIFDNVGAAIGEFSAYADRTYVHGVYSAGCETVYGYSQAEMTGDRALWLSRVLPEDVEAIILPSYERIFAGESFAIEYRFRDKTDTIRWIAETLVSRWDEAAACWQVTAMAIDISDRKQLELSLQASEAKLSQIINSAIVAIASFRIFSNRDWIYDYFSAGCEVVFGYTAQELMDNPRLWWSRVWPADREAVLVPLVDELLVERDVAAEFRFCHRDGSLRWISSSHASRRIGEDCWQVTVVNADISDRKQAELALQQQIRQEQVLADIAQEIRQSLELEQVLHSTVARVRDWLNCDRAVIFRFRPDWQGDVIMESVGEGWTAILSTTIVDPCFEDRFVEPYHQGHVSVLNDIHQAGLEPCYVELLQQFQVQASLAVPILQGRGLWGLLIVHHCAAPRQWQATEIAFLKRLSTQVGIAIQQAELYAQIRQELSQRAQMQTVLQESEERFRTLSAAAPVGILQTNADGICLYANRAWQQMSGLSLENSLGNGWLQAIHPGDRAWVFQIWDASLKHQRVGQAEFRLLTPDRETRWISARVAPIKSATADIVGYVSTYEDITDRKLAEQALQVSEQRLQAILDYSPAIIYLIDAQNRHLLVNRSYAEQFATTPDHLVGKTLHEVWPEETANSFAAQNQAILATGQLLQIEDTAPLADGVHSYLTVKFPLTDAAGTPYALCGISTDITDKKRLEAQFYQAQRLESLGTLAGGIAHDLNNVLTPILTLAQVLRLTQKGLDARGLEQLQLLETSARRGGNLVKQILSVTRTSQGEPTAVDLAALLQEEIELMRQSLPKAIAIQADLPAPGGSQPALGMILADPTYLHQIILNLCVNARDAMANGGTLTIAATTVFVDEAMAAQHLDAQVGHYATITVADTGTGIAPEVQERMFDPFFTTKAPGQGTGLGLATVRGLVRSSQGFLQVVSEVGQGTEFKVYFPLMADQAVEQVLGEQAATKPAATTTSVNPGALVLVVEDEEVVRQMLRSLLESCHYRLLLAEDGAAALGLYHQYQTELQLVVTDVMMPVLDGLTLIERLRALNAELPILALSGIPSQASPALAAGATYFLHKPFEADELLRLVAIATA